MQKLKDIFNWLGTRDGDLFSAGILLALGVSSLSESKFILGLLEITLCAWYLYDAAKQVGE